MELLLDRFECGESCTIGRMSVNGAFECFTLEDVVRSDGVKIFGETAIPAGDYSVDISFSPRFKRDLPLLMHVNGFDGVRIHPGNTAEDTLGCILVGRQRGANMILESKLAFDALFAKMQAAQARNETITLEIRNSGAPAAKLKGVG
ncbi:MAG TPA: DUF5675 family protein [Acetobacteraceae bacterium]